MTSVADGVLQFLQGFKNAESLEEGVRQAISVPTQLDEILVDRVRRGGNVFVTGTAGSGKTHLLEVSRNALSESFPVVSELNYRRKHILFVPDATELSPDERTKALASASRHAAVVAINEGPLRETSEHEDGDFFRQALDGLREARLGAAHGWNPERPTVIDMSGYDPIEAGVIAELLGLSVLEDCVHLVGDARTVRAEAWEQLRSARVRQRVAEVVRIVGLVAEGWMFRDLWDLVADLVTGGEDDEQFPTSPWFWRLFNGNSKISQTLRRVCSPLQATLPGLDSRIHYGDWNAVIAALPQDAHFIPLSQPDKPDVFEWLKCQVLVLNAGTEASAMLVDSDDTVLQRAMVESRAEELLGAINAYMGYGILPASWTELALWVVHAVERKTVRPLAQIRLGTAPVKDFAIRRSVAVYNSLPSTPPVPGSAYYFVHVPSGSRMRITKEKLRLLKVGRSFRMRDRAYTDLDYALYTFFGRILVHLSGSAPGQQRVGFCRFNFEEFSAETYEYNVSEDPPGMEEVLGW